MVAKLKVTGIEAAMKKLRKDIDTKVLPQTIVKGQNLVRELQQATPVDTGEARDGWKLGIEGTKVVITNDVQHIADLNKGSSQQAPAYFIEKTVLENKDVVPVGTIVSYR